MQPIIPFDGSGKSRQPIAKKGRKVKPEKRSLKVKEKRSIRKSSPQKKQLGIRTLRKTRVIKK